MKKYIVQLAKEERASLSKLIAQGKASARKLTHARILLKADSSEDTGCSQRRQEPQWLSAVHPPFDQMVNTPMSR